MILNLKHTRPFFHTAGLHDTTPSSFYFSIGSIIAGTLTLEAQEYTAMIMWGLFRRHCPFLYEPLYEDTSVSSPDGVGKLKRMILSNFFRYTSLSFPTLQSWLRILKLYCSIQQLIFYWNWYYSLWLHEKLIQRQWLTTKTHLIWAEFIWVCSSKS